MDLRTAAAVILVIAGFMVNSGGGGGILPPAPSSDRESIAVFYESLAAGVQNDGAKSGDKFYKDTASFREAHVNALRLWRDVKAVGSIPGLGEAVDGVLAEAIGLEVQPMTPDVRSKVVAACNDVARRLRDGSL